MYHDFVWKRERGEREREERDIVGTPSSEIVQQGTVNLKSCQTDILFKSNWPEERTMIQLISNHIGPLQSNRRPKAITPKYFVDFHLK